MERRRQGKARGFTLIELMGVIAIMGVLFVLVMPTIRGFTIRAKVTEAMQMLASCRNQVYEVYASGSELPDANNYGCEASNPSRFVQEIETTEEGIIIVQLGNQIGDLRLELAKISLAPLNSQGQLMDADDLGTPIRRWRCGNTADGTDLNVTYLPASCRG